MLIKVGNELVVHLYFAVLRFQAHFFAIPVKNSEYKLRGAGMRFDVVLWQL